MNITQTMTVDEYRALLAAQVSSPAQPRSGWFEAVTLATPAPKVSEEEFMASVIELAKARGWKVFHVRDSRRSAAGFPDLMCVRGPRCLAVELKTATGRVTPAQAEWLAALAAAGIPAYVWRPADWDDLVKILE